jgi:hypothetical protein
VSINQRQGAAIALAMVEKFGSSEANLLHEVMEGIPLVLRVHPPVSAIRSKL